MSNSEISDGESEDSISLSLNSIESELSLFRERWQQEIESSKFGLVSPTKQLQLLSNNSTTLEKETELIDLKAKNYFLQGTKFERSGKLYEAIQCYKRAEQLVPDIEFRFYESTKSKSDAEFRFEKRNLDKKVNVSKNDSEGDVNILDRFSKLVRKTGRICLPSTEQNTTHISVLPAEIFLYILRWIVSRELDIHSLNIVSQVCKGFYVYSRDPEIWRIACVRIWGRNCVNFKPKYESWQRMFLKKPRLRYNGCYISKTTYVRYGENNFQDQFYKPWHLIEYFRYLRFFPEGKVLMLTSAEDPQSCVSSLKYRFPRNATILVGHYRLHDNHVTLILKKQETKKEIISNNNRRRKCLDIIHDSGEQTFHAEFEIANHQKRPNSQLKWSCYIIHTKYKNGQESSSRLHLGGRYPSFIFSRVKNYTQESEYPLI